MNKVNQKIATTKAGNKVDTKADAEVELLAPTSPSSCDEVEVAFPRADPTLGSLLGSWRNLLSLLSKVRCIVERLQ